MTARTTRRCDRATIILAAGASQRMGQFKPLMMLGRRTVLERVIRLYQQVGLTDIRVVTGCGSQAIRAVLAAHPVSVIHNPACRAGMFTSVLAGVSTLPATVGSFFIHPVDIPLVRPHTLTRMMVQYDQHRPTLLYPVFDGKRGHPPLIDAAIADAIARYDGRKGLRAVLRRFEKTALDLPVADEGVLLDMDTPQDHRRLCTRWSSKAVLTDDECRVLMEQVCGLPSTLVKHCRLVATVAEALARALADSAALDVPLIRAAALVHDVARLKDDHAATGAERLAKMGFPAMAAIVAHHMDLAVSDTDPLDEAQIVFLADKLVDGCQVGDIVERFDAKLGKYSRDPQAAVAILQRRQAAMTIQHKVEQACHDTIQQVLIKAGIKDRGRSCNRF